MPDSESAHDDLQKIFSTSSQYRHLRPKWNQFSIDHAAFFQAENVHAQGAFEEILMRLDDTGFAAQESDSRISRWEKMIMDAEEMIGRIEKFRAEISRGLQRHVAAVAVWPRLGRVIETARAMAGNSAQEKSV